MPGHAAHGRSEDYAKVVTTEGLPYPGTEIRILDEHNRPVPAGRPAGSR